MENKYEDERDVIKQRYAEAFSYIDSKDMLLFNPKKAYSIFEKLANEGFEGAGFCRGLMTCIGIGTERNVENGKKILKSYEKSLGYVTEVILEQYGLYEELALAEKNVCIEYWINNHQTIHALFLKMQRDNE